ncbi:cell death abnormality protein 1-like isoform X2 [Mercenaria mercenaria]|uniref:cell death abnormality protein 1-like isoform X2 n=1 Tax=Mercenaria mercenaria TaxID=6596 RepID=UPI00234F9CD3|nr:cell death abnormality protein 1-like isoform X2 [Mercenaria mercenaria]
MTVSLILTVTSLLLLFLRSSVLGYSNGAPPQACVDMVPLHGVAQSTANFPYSIEVSSETYCNNSIILVTINGNGKTFKGFFCQARTQISIAKTNGTLIGADSNKTAKSQCSGEVAALTHNSSNEVSSTRFTWQPEPSLTSDIYFVCTVVQRRVDFWVKQASRKLTYDPNNCPPAGLPTFCGNDQVCNTAVMFSICDRNADDDGNCVCPSDRKLISPIDTSCSPKVLGDNCEVPSDCRYVPGNVTCTLGSKCACAQGFVAKPNQNECIPETVSDVTCDSNSDCIRYQYASCDTQMRKCQCTGNVKEVNGKCELKGLGDECKEESDCSGVTNTVCDVTCKCRSSYIQQINQCVIDPTSCFADPCKDVPNSFCEAGNCICQSAFKKENGLCIPKGLDDACEDISDCSNVENARCETTCKCRPLYIRQNDQCIPGLSDSCSQDQDCGGSPSLVCDSGNNRCACSNAYKQDKDKCIMKGISDSCTVNEDCRGVQNSVCTNNRCACSGAYKQVNGACLMRALGETCVDEGSCGVPMSVCDKNNQCKCAPGYMEQNSACVLEVYDIVCVNDADCSSVFMSICDTLNTKKCICPAGYIRNDTRCVRRVLGDDCTLDEDCKGVPMAICDESTRCACPRWYKQLSATQCEVKVLDDNCKYNEDCRGVSNALCDKIQTQTCKCMTAYKELSNQTHKYCAVREIGDTCTNKAECAGILDSNCDEGSTGKCVCPPGLKVVNYGCVPKVLGKDCNAFVDCKGVAFAICSINKKCTCSYGYNENLMRDTCDGSGLIAGVSSNLVISSVTFLACFGLQRFLC